MSKRSLTFVLVLLLLLLAGAWAAHKTAFDWHSLTAQLRSLSLSHVALGVAAIYAGFWFRALRWKVLMGQGERHSATSLLGPQFIGFTVVALFGRLADLARPYLIARRTGLPIATQVAVYSVERIFDLAAAAILFSVTLAFAPHDLPHHETYARAGMVSLTATLVLAALALGVRFFGGAIARLTTALVKPFAPAFAAAAVTRLDDFRNGLEILRSFQSFAAALTLSLLLWLGIAEAYVQAARAFPATPQLASLTFTQAMLIMATAMGGSMIQLPILGWFTQIGLLAAALCKFFDAPVEAATATATVALFITNLSIVPAGAIAAKLGGTSLRAAAQTSEPDA